jgi:hypothetical protein
VIRHNAYLGSSITCTLASGACASIEGRRKNGGACGIHETIDQHLTRSQAGKSCDRVSVDSVIYGVPFADTFAYKPLLA